MSDPEKKVIALFDLNDPLRPVATADGWFHVDEIRHEYPSIEDFIEEKTSTPMNKSFAEYLIGDKDKTIIRIYEKTTLIDLLKSIEI